MHLISNHLPDLDCYFSQFYSKHPWVELGQKVKILDNTIIGVKSHWRKKADAYLVQHHLRNDYRGERFGNEYDLYVLCADFVVPKEMLRKKTVFVQEGMTDPLRLSGKIVKFLNMPAYWAFDTSLMGYSNKPDIYCAASEGYRQHYIQLGVDPEKIIVTGIPNFDNAAAYLDNDFPHKDYVLVATSDVRETFRKDDRVAFIKKAVETANGRPMIFKLHPNEFYERAEKEIRDNAPADAMIFQDGNTNAMIANCEELICQYSTIVYVGLALGKKVHSYYDLEYLKQMMPVQNGGKSAERIAEIISGYVAFKGKGKDFLKTFKPDWLDEHHHYYTSPQRLIQTA